MKFSATILAALLSATAFAAPAADVAEIEARDGDINMMVASQQWTITNMKRVCNSADTSCVWTFGINTHTAPVTQCKFTVKGSPADQTDTSNVACGGYTIGTGWSGQFGPGNGFTTLSVVNNAKKLIIYPSYTDKQLDTNKVVKPNQSYTPQNLP